jgi:PIN domain nuclease of toxin-antitoxin system
VEALTYLDTHVVAWLFAGRVDLIAKKAAAAIEAHDLAVSPMVILELEYLHETERLAVGAETIVRSLQATIGLIVCELSFATVVGAAREQTWTRDPFDRVIVGHAAAADRTLVTKDRGIHRHYRRAVW